MASLDSSGSGSQEAAVKLWWEGLQSSRPVTAVGASAPPPPPWTSPSGFLSVLTPWWPASLSAGHARESKAEAVTPLASLALHRSAERCCSHRPLSARGKGPPQGANTPRQGPPGTLAKAVSPTCPHL